MKLKSDFITNSSSSSFIVAIKGTLTLEDILSCYYEEILDFVCGDDIEYYGEYDETIEKILATDDEKEKVHLFAKEILKSLDNNDYNSVKLDGWRVSVHTCSNEDGEPVEEFFYDYSPKAQRENFVVGGYE